MQGVFVCQTRLKLSWKVKECKPLLDGEEVAHAAQARRCRHGARRLVLHLGEAVQVESMKPKLKPPGTQRLKLKWETLLSKYAFKFNLRRYIWGAQQQVEQGETRTRSPCGRAVQIDPIEPTLKAPGTKRLKLKCHDLLLNCGFKFSLRRYDVGAPRRAGIRRARALG